MGFDSETDLDRFTNPAVCCSSAVSLRSSESSELETFWKEDFGLAVRQPETVTRRGGVSVCKPASASGG